MIINFSNKCRSAVTIKSEGGDTIEVQPFQTESINCAPSDQYCFYISRAFSSFVHKREYIFVINTLYTFINITDNETLQITREKTCFHPLPAYYDRLFLSASKAEKIAESHVVTNSELLKQAYKRDRRIDRFLINPWTENVLESAILICIGILILYCFSWWATLLYAICAYFLMIAINWIGEGIASIVSPKVTGIKSDAQIFLSWFENENILAYYANKDRKPFMGRIEVN